MKNRIRRAAVVPLIASVLAACAPAGARLSEADTVPAEVGSLTATVGATGTVRPSQLGTLTFKTTGTVGEVLVEVGDEVEAGDLLAVLTDESLAANVLLARADVASAERALEDLRASTRQAAEAQLAIANARDAFDRAERRLIWNQEGNRATSDTLKAAQAKLAIERARMEEAEAAYRSAPGDLAEGGVKAQTYLAYNNARRAYTTALSAYNWYTGHPTEVEQSKLEADVAVARAQLDDALREYERLKDGPDPADLAAAEARLAAARATLEQARITAPFSGTITAVDIQPGDQVAPGSVAFQLADLSRLYVDVDVSEVDINRVDPDQPATLTFDAILDREYRGRVTEVGAVGEAQQGVVNFKVTLEIEDPDQAVLPGLTAAVNVVVDQIENVLLVPNRAVRVQDGERVVYILRDGAMQVVPIVLGTSSETHSQVLEGDVAEGDAIVLNPPTAFEEFGPPGGGGGFFGRR